jgi:hypothetical protein
MLQVDQHDTYSQVDVDLRGRQFEGLETLLRSLEGELLSS